ncbi:MAG TPA: hypothetical protein VM618_06590 [Acidimicrobiia bacterium]|nr:hypothetical protein [Acidimicrobiia bacterium]
MAQGWRQYLEAGMQFGEMSRAQANKVVQQLVREGQVAEERAKSYVDELVDRSRRRTDDLTKLIQREIRKQLSALGLATKEDLARLERKLTTGAKKTSAKKSSAKKSGAKASSPKASGSGGT